MDEKYQCDNGLLHWPSLCFCRYKILCRDCQWWWWEFGHNNRMTRCNLIDNLYAMSRLCTSNTKTILITRISILVRLALSRNWMRFKCSRVTATKSNVWVMKCHQYEVHATTYGTTMHFPFFSRQTNAIVCVCASINWIKRMNFLLFHRESNSRDEHVRTMGRDNRYLW